MSTPWEERKKRLRFHIHLDLAAEEEKRGKGKRGGPKFVLMKWGFKKKRKEKTRGEVDLQYMGGERVAFFPAGKKKGRGAKLFEILEVLHRGRKAKERGHHRFSPHAREKMLWRREGGGKKKRGRGKVP